MAALQTSWVCGCWSPVGIPEHPNFLNPRSPELPTLQLNPKAQTLKPKCQPPTAGGCREVHHKAAEAVERPSKPLPVARRVEAFRVLAFRVEGFRVEGLGFVAVRVLGLRVQGQPKPSIRVHWVSTACSAGSCIMGYGQLWVQV